MNPDDDRMILALGRGVDIERLPLVLRLGVGKVTVDLRLGGEERGGEERRTKRRVMVRMVVSEMRERWFYSTVILHDTSS